MTDNNHDPILEMLLALDSDAPASSEGTSLDARVELYLRAIHGPDRLFSAAERKAAEDLVIQAMAAETAEQIAERKALRELRAQGVESKTVSDQSIPSTAEQVEDGNSVRKLQKSQKVAAQQPMTLLLAAADQASEGVENSEATKEALMQLETLVTDQGSITFWQDGSSIYVSFDDAVSVQCIELVGFEEQPFNLVRSIANPNLFEVGELTVEAASYFLELRLYNPERYKVIVR